MPVRQQHAHEHDHRPGDESPDADLAVEPGRRHRIGRTDRMPPVLGQILAAQRVLHQPAEHAHRRRAESPVPGALRGESHRATAAPEAVALRQPAGDQRGDERSGVDAHVVERVARVPPHVVRRVELPDQHADVALEQPRAGGDQHQPQVEQGERRNGQADVPRHDHDAADEDGGRRPSTRSASQPPGKDRR